MDQRDPNSQQTSKEGQGTNGSSNRNGGHESTNGRQANEAGTENAEYWQTFIRRLIATIAHEQPETVDRLIAFIRSGASQDEIFRALSDLTAEASSEPVNRTRAP